MNNLKDLGIQWKSPQGFKSTKEGFQDGPHGGGFYNGVLIGSYTFALHMCDKKAAYPIPGVGDADDCEFWVMEIPNTIHNEIVGKVSCPMPDGSVGCPRYLGLPVSKTKFFPTYEYNPIPINNPFGPEMSDYLDPEFWQ
jgi:hypothetical protein